MQRGIGLNDVLDQTRRVLRPGDHGASEAADDAGADRSREAQRVADGDDQLADAQRVGVAELGGMQVITVRAQDGQIGERIAPDDVETQLASIGENGDAARRTVDDVSGRHDEPVARDRHA